jgi:hypothetical protein
MTKENLNSIERLPKNMRSNGREIYNYVVGLPFPGIHPNDPLAGAKVMWNQEPQPVYLDSATVLLIRGVCYSVPRFSCRTADDAARPPVASVLTTSRHCDRLWMGP